MRSRTRIYAVIRDLTPAVRGGRIKPNVKRLADLLNLTPVLGLRREGDLGALQIGTDLHPILGKMAEHDFRVDLVAGATQVDQGHLDRVSSR